MEMSEDRLIVSYELEGAVDIEKLSASFDGLAAEYRKTLVAQGLSASESAARLFLTKIRQGSIEAEIGTAIVAFGQTMATINYALIFAELTDRIKIILDWASGKSENKPSLSTEECRDFKNFLSPIVGRRSTRLGVQHARFISRTNPASMREK